MNYGQALERETPDAMWQDMILAHKLADNSDTDIMRQTWESIQDKSSIDFICGEWLTYPQGSFEQSHAKELEAITKWRLILKGEDCSESFYINKYMYTDEDSGSKPRTSISFFDTAAICNQLALDRGDMPRYWFETSDQGFVPCTPANLDIEKVIEIHENLDSKAERMPTSEEWVYACRCGTDTDTPWGDHPSADDKQTSEEFLNPYAWFWENSNGELQPVGKKLPTPWGCYDMLGNAFEWTTTLWSEDEN